MILTSQVPTEHWHEQIGDPTIADSILDRLVHNAHRIALDGESMRKGRGGKPLSRSNCTEGLCIAEWGKGTQTPSPCPTPPSPLKTFRTIDDVNKFRHHQVSASLRSDLYSHQTGILCSHRRNTQNVPLQSVSLLGFSPEYRNQPGLGCHAP